MWCMKDFWNEGLLIIGKEIKGYVGWFYVRIIFRLVGFGLVECGWVFNNVVVF